MSSIPEGNTIDYEEMDEDELMQWDDIEIDPNMDPEEERLLLRSNEEIAEDERISRERRWKEDLFERLRPLSPIPLEFTLEQAKARVREQRERRADKLVREADEYWRKVWGPKKEDNKKLYDKIMNNLRKVDKILAVKPYRFLRPCFFAKRRSIDTDPCSSADVNVCSDLGGQALLVDKLPVCETLVDGTDHTARAEMSSIDNKSHNLLEMSSREEKGNMSSAMSVTECIEGTLEKTQEIDMCCDNLSEDNLKPIVEETVSELLPKTVKNDMEAIISSEPGTFEDVSLSTDTLFETVRADNIENEGIVDCNQVTCEDADVFHISQNFTDIASSDIKQNKPADVTSNKIEGEEHCESEIVENYSNKSVSQLNDTASETRDMHECQLTDVDTVGDNSRETCSESKSNESCEEDLSNKLEEDAENENFEKEDEEGSDETVILQTESTTGGERGPASSEEETEETECGESKEMEFTKALRNKYTVMMEGKVENVMENNSHDLVIVYARDGDNLNCVSESTGKTCEIYEENSVGSLNGDKKPEDCLPTFVEDVYMNVDTDVVDIVETKTMLENTDTDFIQMNDEDTEEISDTQVKGIKVVLDSAGGEKEDGDAKYETSCVNSGVFSVTDELPVKQENVIDIEPESACDKKDDDLPVSQDTVVDIELESACDKNEDKDDLPVTQDNVVDIELESACDKKEDDLPVSQDTVVDIELESACDKNEDIDDLPVTQDNVVDIELESACYKKEDNDVKSKDSICDTGAVSINDELSITQEKVIDIELKSTCDKKEDKDDLPATQDNIDIELESACNKKENKDDLPVTQDNIVDIELESACDKKEEDDLPATQDNIDIELESACDKKEEDDLPVSQDTVVDIELESSCDKNEDKDDLPVTQDNIVDIELEDVKSKDSICDTGAVSINDELSITQEKVIGIELESTCDKKEYKDDLPVTQDNIVNIELESSCDKKEYKDDLPLTQENIDIELESTCDKEEDSDIKSEDSSCDAGAVSINDEPSITQVKVIGIELESTCEKREDKDDLPVTQDNVVDIELESSCYRKENKDDLPLTQENIDIELESTCDKKEDSNIESEDSSCDAGAVSINDELPITQEKFIDIELEPTCDKKEDKDDLPVTQENVIAIELESTCDQNEDSDVQSDTSCADGGAVSESDELPVDLEEKNTEYATVSDEEYEVLEINQSDPFEGIANHDFTNSGVCSDTDTEKTGNITICNIPLEQSDKNDLDGKEEEDIAFDKGYKIIIPTSNAEEVLEISSVNVECHRKYRQVSESIKSGKNKTNDDHTEVKSQNLSENNMKKQLMAKPKATDDDDYSSDAEVHDESFKNEEGHARIKRRIFYEEPDEDDDSAPGTKRAKKDKGKTKRKTSASKHKSSKIKRKREVSQSSSGSPFAKKVKLSEVITISDDEEEEPQYPAGMKSVEKSTPVSSGIIGTSVSKIQEDTSQKREFKKGQSVYAKWTDKRFYPGILVGPRASSMWMVAFNDGAKRKVPEKDLIYNDSLPEGFKVLANRENSDCADFFLATISSIERDPEDSEKVHYRVVFEDMNEPVVVSQDNIALEEAQVEHLRAAVSPQATCGKVSTDSVKSRRPAQEPVPSSSQLTPLNFLGILAGNLLTRPKTLELAEEDESADDVATSVKKPGRGRTKKTRDSMDLLGPIPPAGSRMFMGKCFFLTCSKEVFWNKEKVKSSQNEDIEFDTDFLPETPFDRTRLLNQLKNGGAIIYDSFADLDEEDLKTTYVVANRPSCTEIYVKCLAHGIKLVSHSWVVAVCKGKNTNMDQHRLPAGWSLEKKCFVPQVKRSTRPLRNKDVMILCTSDDFWNFWSDIVTCLGGRVHRYSSISDDDLEKRQQLLGIWAVVADSALGKSMGKDIVVKKDLIPVVTTAWLLQCLINWTLCSVDAHPAYRHTHRSRHSY